jgi:hypothetical protein
MRYTSGERAVGQDREDLEEAAQHEDDLES